MLSFWGRKQVGVPGLFNLVVISLTSLQLLFVSLGSFLNLLSVMAYFGCQLDMPGKRKLQLNNQLQVVGMAIGAFSPLLIDEDEPSPLWAVPVLGKWASAA